MLPYKEAQTFAIHLSARHKPHLYTGKSAPFGAVPIISVALSSLVAIERLLSNMSLHSMRIAVAKVVKICRLTATLYKKVLNFM